MVDTRRQRRPKNGFTLMELLIVISVIAILGTIIMGSATYITRVARDKRAQATAKVLETALYRYRTDYGRWPEAVTDNKYSFAGDQNKYIFGVLRHTSPRNRHRVRYLDESSVFTKDGNGKAIRLSQAGSGDMPLVFIRRNGSLGYYSASFDINKDSVKIKADTGQDDLIEYDDD